MLVLGAGFVAALAPELDAGTLRQSLSEIGGAFHALPIARYRESVGVFCGGGILGACLAVWWTRSRLPWRSVLLVDNRLPDMTLDALIAHVRRGYANDDQEAVQLIVKAGRARSLSVWTRCASGTVRRASQRVIDAVARTPKAPAIGDPYGSLLFVATEVRELWPHASHLVIASPEVVHRGDSAKGS